MLNSYKFLSLPLATFLGLLFVLAVAAFSQGAGLPFGSEGTKDFIQYWSAWQIISSGGNPYDDLLMQAVQSRVGCAANETIMMWNPPWVPILLAPILSLPFEASALIWFLCNLSFLLVAVVLTPRALGYGKLPAWVYGLGAIFIPAIDCVKWGQLSLLLTAGFVLFLFNVHRRRFFSAGLSLILLFGKPHLFLLFAVPGFLWLRQLEKAQRDRFLKGVLSGGFFVLAVTLLIAPHAISWWLYALSDTQQRVYLQEGRIVPIRLWQTATIASLVRSSIWSSKGYAPPDWPLWFFPALGLTLTTYYFFLRREEPVRWNKVAPALLCCCLISANYGWLYDQSVLIITHIFLVCSSYRAPSRIRDLGGILAIQIAILLMNIFNLRSQHLYLWVPIALLAILFFMSTAKPPAASE